MISNKYSFLNRIVILFLAATMLGVVPSVLHGATLMRTLVSQRTGEEYTLYIYIPENLRNIETRYPVVYLLDGDRHFADVQKTVDRRIRDLSLPMVMIVGVGYGIGDDMRRRDYTPSYMKEYPESGGVRHFFHFMRNELIPYVDNHFKTVAASHGRCLAGHSLGGIAVYYGLMHHHDLFDMYIAVSPALWWDREIFYRMRADLSHIGQARRPRLYTACGAAEPRLTDYRARTYLAILKRMSYGRVSMRYSLVPEKNHDDVAVAAVVEGMDFMFK